MSRLGFVVGYLAESVLLLVWYSVPCVPHSYDLLFGDYYCVDLLSVVWRGRSKYFR